MRILCSRCSEKPLEKAVQARKDELESYVEKYEYAKNENTTKEIGT